MASRGYQELIAWQKAMDLVAAVYGVSADLPTDERFGLTSQIGRAAVSIPSNIAEGHARSSTKDFARFVDIALGSVAEVETQLMLTVRLNFISASAVDPVLTLAGEVGRIAHGLHKSLQ